MPKPKNPLVYVSDDELWAELERRKNQASKPPQMLPHPDFSELVNMVGNMLETAIKDKWWDEDNSHYIEEAVMKAIYGDAYLLWRKAQKF